MRLIRSRFLASLLTLGVMPSWTYAQKAGGFTPAQVQEWLEKSVESGRYRAGMPVGPLTIVASKVTDHHMIIRLAMPETTSAPELQEVINVWPTVTGKWCNIESSRAVIDDYKVAFTLVLVGPNARTLATQTVSSATCPELRERIVRTAAADASSAEASTRLSAMTEETKIYTRAVEAENSPQGEMCRGYIGQTLALTSFDSAVARYAKLTPKGEFETTAQYEERRRTVLAAAGKKPVVIGVPVDRDYLDYDADKQELLIGSFAFGEPGTSSTTLGRLAAFIYLDRAGLKATTSSQGSVAVEVSSSDVRTGTYDASNALGATIRVSKITRTTKAIFDKEIEAGLSSSAKWTLFPVAQLEPHAVGSLSLSPAEARALKGSLRTAFLVEPKEPWLVTGSDMDTPAADFKDPRKFKEVSKILVADIQCGFVLNAAGKVLGAYVTN